jgi:hypothetical protein
MRATPPTNKTWAHTTHTKIFVAVARISPSVKELSKGNALLVVRETRLEGYRPAAAGAETVEKMRARRGAPDTTLSGAPC